MFLTSIIWPSAIECLFAAFLFGGADPDLYQYHPVKVTPPPCAPYSSYIREDALILEHGLQRVEIPFPERAGWNRLEYWWGRDVAYIEGREVPVKMGPITWY